MQTVNVKLPKELVDKARKKIFEEFGEIPTNIEAGEKALEEFVKEEQPKKEKRK